MKCKMYGCGQEGNQCGYCGESTCMQHGYAVQSTDNLGTEHEGWICNDCAEEISEKVRPFMDGQ
jgi:hypothetical protein